MWIMFLTAFALVLILEGVLPLAAPRLWRETFVRMTSLADGQLRFLGLASLLTGLALLFLVN